MGIHWGYMRNGLYDVSKCKVRLIESLAKYQNGLLEEEVKPELLFTMHKKISKNLEK